MKKVLVLLLALTLLLTLPAYAEETCVTVTVANGDVKAHERITLTDTDGDGKLTVRDALYLVHEKAYEGGAEAGFLSEDGAYGLQLSKLWGISGTGFGYYVNDASAMHLGDELSNGDKVVAYVYTDTANWSDTYTYFDKDTASTSPGGSVTLTLKAITMDAQWNPVQVPVEGAKLLVNGQPTQYITDAEGCVTLSFDETGTYTVSAASDTAVLVPSVCVVSVTENPHTADAFTVTGALAATVILAVAAYVLRRRTVNEA